ncbi:MAG: K+/H+ antiporter subunit F [Bacteroidota bacterium]|jgi:multicomponent K+:H+ antiporter subunit F
MLDLALAAAFVAFAAAIALASIRLALGPSVPDRVLALDTLYVNVVAITILLGIRYDSFAYFEAALVIALFGFVATVALARFAARGDVMD